MECPTYNVLRQNLFDNITDNENENEFNGLDEMDKFCFLLADLENGDLVCEYLNKTFQIRKFLIEKPKQNGCRDGSKNHFREIQKGGPFSINLTYLMRF